MASGFGFFPASGTDYSTGQEPALARRLNRLGRSLHLHLIGISGARTPAHSVAVGGFADDPHTRGEASDTPGVESIPESTLRRFGLTRPLPGASEADHIQLLGSGGTSAPTRSPRTTTLADLWTQAGGSRRLAPIMAAIAMAESGGQVDASHQNDDGTTDYGIWQINSSHPQFDPAKLTSDPAYNARAAVAVERSQGLTAWTTYSSGEFRTYMGSGSNTVSFPARTRPGGDASGDSSGVETIFASYTQGQTEDVSLWSSLSHGFKWFFSPPKLNDPALPHHVKIDPFGAGTAIKDTGDFLKWVAWLFHPVNILRAVEFITGLTIMGIGIQSAFAVWKDAPEEAATAKIGRAAKSGAREAVEMTPVGRAKRVSQARKVGKREARQKTRATERQTAQRKARVKESKQETQRGNTRQRRRSHRRTPLAEDIPF